MTTTPREQMARLVASQPTGVLRDAMRELDTRVESASPRSPEWVALMATLGELRARTHADLSARSSRSLAQLLRAVMQRPSVQLTRLGRLDFDAAERIIRERFPVADLASVEYLDGLDLAQLPDDEYAHLRVLLEAAGL